MTAWKQSIHNWGGLNTFLQYYLLKQYGWTYMMLDDINILYTYFHSFDSEQRQEEPQEDKPSSDHTNTAVP